MRPVHLSDLYKAAAVAAIIITATVSAHSYSQREILAERDSVTISSTREESRPSASARSEFSSSVAERSASVYQMK